MGEWHVAVEEADGHEWEASMHILEDTVEHFEGEYTGRLINFKAAKGKWVADLLFDDHKDHKLSDRDEASGKHFKLSGTYEDEEAYAEVTSPDEESHHETWTLTKTGEAYE